VVHAVAEIEPEFQKGITFTHGYRGGNNMRSEASAGALRHLRQRLSDEWIAVNPFGYQTSVHTIGIRFGGDPRDEHLIDGIRQAQQLGLKVMLKPHIWLSEQDGGDCRGTIGFDTEREWKEWFSNNERFLLHYAQIAAQTEAEILCVGVELSRTVTDRPDDWRQLISKVREIYPGPLTYAANWWGDYDVVEFWDELDYIGINAFFPLTLEEEATDLATLLAGARAVADQIETVHKRTGKPVLLTEVGFRSVRGATVKPWEWP